MKKVRIHVLISGNVQGVFFRSFLKSNARMYEVDGWVKNIPNGKVEAVFEGEEHDVEKMVELCRQGPPGAEIRNVEVRKEKRTTDLGPFEIR